MLTILQGNGNAPHRRQRRPPTSAAAGARIVGLEARTAWDARAPRRRSLRQPPAETRDPLARGIARPYGKASRPESISTKKSRRPVSRTPASARLVP